METITILSVKDKGETLVARYDYENAKVTQTIQREVLLSFIEDHGLNEFEGYNKEMTDVEQTLLKPETVLQNETEMVVLKYLEFNFK